SSGTYYKGVGVASFVDGKGLGSRVFEPDRFYFEAAARTIARERARGPLFLYVYLTANHFTWDYPFRADLTPAGCREPGNAMPEVNENLRRQAMSEGDYSDFLARLDRDFPGEQFLIVRYGDHQPDFAKLLIDPAINVTELGRRLMTFDPRYFMTYYAIDTVNFWPAALGSALDVLDAPYLPLVVQEAAGLPLDPSFSEQKKILARCNGLFYGCAGGAEAGRFTPMLIDAGLIRGLCLRGRPRGPLRCGRHRAGRETDQRVEHRMSVEHRPASDIAIVPVERLDITYAPQRWPFAD